MDSCVRIRLFLLAAFAVTLAAAPNCAQSQAHWADANDPDAKQMIEAERKWAVLECEPSNVVAEVLADDFVGTSPDGPIYNKKEALVEDRSEKAAGCKLLSARVRYYSPDIAIIYGKETSARTTKDGKQYQRTLIWTDTWLKRNGKWQIVAVQDMRDPKS